MASAEEGKSTDLQKRIDAFIQNGKKEKRKLGDLIQVIEEIARTGSQVTLGIQFERCF
jgi:hypothetical protein